MNMRGCGDGEEFSPSIYHAGRSEDVAIAMAELSRTYLIRSFALVGYSMGGNLVLKLAGERGAAAPPYLKAVVGVSPLMDLAASSAALHEPQNRLYASRFLSEMLKRFRRKIELYPGLYTANGLGKIRTVRQFDEQVVARYGGFASADDYYYSVASSNWAQEIAVTTLTLHALDDPFIRMTPDTRAKLVANPRVMLVETRHGGHCAFLSLEPGDAGLGGENAAGLPARHGRGLTDEFGGAVEIRTDLSHRGPLGRSSSGTMALLDECARNGVAMYPPDPERCLDSSTPLAQSDLLLFETAWHEARLCLSRHHRGALPLLACRAERALDKLLTSLALVIS
jgi:pimeloyl-ACP methyl ester carboxylesterase